MNARSLLAISFVLALIVFAPPISAQTATPATANWTASNPPRIYTVSVHNSPGVPDAGAHCIICGLATGNFTAIEPNLGICVVPDGVSGAKESCTTTCEPGHDCKHDFNDPPRLKFPGPAVHVYIADVNRQTGQGTVLMDFDEPNALKCSIASPCQVPNPQGGAAVTVGFDFGTIDCNSAPDAPPPASISGLTLFGMPTAGMLPDPGMPTIPPNQHNPWREYFCLSQPSQKGGWIVQKIEYETAQNPTQPVVFWETFVVLPGQQHSAYPDTFKKDFTAGQSGFMSVNANATFYEGLSNDFVRTHFFLNMPGDKLSNLIQQPSGVALSTTNSSIVAQLNQAVSSSGLKTSNNLYRAWYLTYKNGSVVH